MKNKKKQNLIVILIIILFIAISGYLLINKYIQSYYAKEEVKDTVIKTESTEEIASIEDLKKEYGNNDIIGVLKINSLNINTPVVQTTNNDYYINHTLRRGYSFIGATFVDYRHDIENSKQINIYGHNSTKYDLPFKKLENYLEKDFYDNNKEITFQYNNELKNYEIFSVAIVEKTSKEEHMQFNYSTEEQWNNHFQRLKDKSLYDYGIVVDGSDNIIVLQTCLFGQYNGKLLIVVAKEIKF